MRSSRQLGKCRGCCLVLGTVICNIAGETGGREPESGNSSIKSESERDRVRKSESEKAKSTISGGETRITTS